MTYWGKIFYLLIVSGRKTTIEIPASLKAEVEEALTTDGYTINADGTVVKA